MDQSAVCRPALSCRKRLMRWRPGSRPSPDRSSPSACSGSDRRLRRCAGDASGVVRCRCRSKRSSSSGRGARGGTRCVASIFAGPRRAGGARRRSPDHRACRAGRSTRSIPTALDLIVLHEYAHVARYDDRDRLVQASIEAVFAWHPVVWWIARRLDDERERACDDWVVDRTGRPVEYARCLVAVARAGGSWSRARDCPGRRPRRPWIDGARRATDGAAAALGPVCCAMPVVALAAVALTAHGGGLGGRARRACRSRARTPRSSQACARLIRAGRGASVRSARTALQTCQPARGASRRFDLLRRRFPSRVERRALDAAPLRFPTPQR